MDLLIEDIRAAMTQDYKPTVKMMQTLLKEHTRLTQLCEERGREKADLRLFKEKETFPFTAWQDEREERLKAESALSQAREEVKRQRAHCCEMYRVTNMREIVEKLLARAESAEQREKEAYAHWQETDIRCGELQDLLKESEHREKGLRERALEAMEFYAWHLKSCACYTGEFVGRECSCALVETKAALAVASEVL